MLNGTHNVEAMRKLWVISSYLSWSPWYFAQNMGPTSGASCHWTKTGFFNGNMMLIVFLTPDSTGPVRVASESIVQNSRNQLPPLCRGRSWQCMCFHWLVPRHVSSTFQKHLSALPMWRICRIDGSQTAEWHGASGQFLKCNTRDQEY